MSSIALVNKNRLKGLNQVNSNPNVSKADIINCRHCDSRCVKAGFEKNGKQKYQCKSCGKKQVAIYSYNGYDLNLKNNIASLLKEGVGIRGISRLLGISTNTVMKKIKEMGKEINHQKKPQHLEKTLNLLEIHPSWKQ